MLRSGRLTFTDCRQPEIRSSQTVEVFSRLAGELPDVKLIFIEHLRQHCPVHAESLRLRVFIFRSLEIFVHPPPHGRYVYPGYLMLHTGHYVAPAVPSVGRIYLFPADIVCRQNHPSSFRCSSRTWSSPAVRYPNTGTIQSVPSGGYRSPYFRRSARPCCIRSAPMLY